ncbi:hypothetical protein [Methylobacterium nigriterrae]|uniref:hypothetical protein n=1 Tax=Methylobacterium nigriterrae TaxID=3127512 RepID=UPI0030138650
MERLIAEAEACHTEEVRLVQALTGDDRSAAEAGHRLRETEDMLTLLHSVQPRPPAIPKKS